MSGWIFRNLSVLHEDQVDDFIEEDEHDHSNNYPNISRNNECGIKRRQAILATLS